MKSIFFYFCATFSHISKQTDADFCTYHTVCLSVILSLKVAKTLISCGIESCSFEEPEKKKTEARGRFCTEEHGKKKSSHFTPKILNLDNRERKKKYLVYDWSMYLVSDLSPWYESSCCSLRGFVQLSELKERGPSVDYRKYRQNVDDFLW